MEVIEKVIRLDPGNFDAWDLKGLALLGLKRYEDALVAIEEAIKISPNNVNTLLGKGVTLYNLKKYKDALRAYEEAIRIDPQNAYVLIGKGVVFSDLGKYKDALRAYEEALRIDPFIDLLHANLGELFFILGDIENASKEVEETLKINEKYTSSFVLSGRIEIDERNYSDAVKSFKEAIRSDPGNPNPLLWNVYAEYLNLEFASNVGDRAYQEGIAAIIRKLERISDLHEKEEEIRLYIYYFLVLSQ